MRKYRIVPFYATINDQWGTFIRHECQWALERKRLIGWWYVTSSVDREKLLEVMRHLEQPSEYL